MYSELVRVNILNKGRIRWLNYYGPVFNMTISRNVFNLLSKDPDMKIEVLDFYDPKKIVARIGIPDPVVVEIQEEKVEEVIEETNEELTEEITEVVEEISTEEILEETDDEIDNAIDAALESYEDDEDDFIVDFPEVDNSVRIYTEEDMKEMTKAQLKSILKEERGYESGEFAPKYHDTLEILKEKVLKTQ